MSKKLKLSDLKFDDKNFNRGTEYGKSLIKKSIEKFGAGRSILIDKNDKIIAGNKTAENFAELGLENIQVVESDGSTLIAVRRTDVDLDTPEGRELALADNQTANINIDFDFEMMQEELEESVMEDWGIQVWDAEDLDLDDFFEEVDENKEPTFKITLEYNEDDYNKVIEAFNKLGGSKEQLVWEFLKLE